MKLNPDDPKWTAYILGELDDTERKQVEKELESSVAAREIVEEIQFATTLLKEELAAPESVGLYARQKHAVSAAASTSNVRWRFSIRRAFAMTAIAAAACLIITAISIPSLLRSRQAADPYPNVRQNRAPVVALQPPSAHFFSGNPARVATTEQSGGPQRNELSRLKEERGNGIAGGVLKPQMYLAQEGFAAEPQVATVFADRNAILPDRSDRSRFNTEAYDFISDNPFVRVDQDPRATFSIDVDTASYSNMRRFLNLNQLPPKDSVRIEEMINYFTYDYPLPAGPHPIAANPEIASAPWNPQHRLVRIGIKGKDVDLSNRKASNLVFLIDVSGSMDSPEKLPLLKSAMKLMIDGLNENDRVAMVVYAGSSGMVLPSTGGDKKGVLINALEDLSAGGSTNGAAGIQLAYDTAISSFIKGGINRVILATDGDFNVGITSQGALVRLIEEKAKSGIFLSVLGFGMGNYKDSTLEQLADKGNGNYAYIDSLSEARKVLVEELGATLMTIAKDVKIQIEFNPAEVAAYRLIGYENRILRHEDFNDDKKDAGDMGAGHTVTALFEVVPQGVDISLPAVDPLKYQQPSNPGAGAQPGEMLNIKMRYKEPDGVTSQLLEIPVVDRGAGFNAASSDFRFAAAVASFGMILRDSPYKAQSTLDAVIEIAAKSKGNDKNGYRDEFVGLARRARELQ